MYSPSSQTAVSSEDIYIASTNFSQNDEENGFLSEATPCGHFEAIPVCDRVAPIRQHIGPECDEDDEQLAELKYPVMTFTLCFVTVAIYLYGIETMIGWNNASMSSLSPPNQKWWFFTGAWWPSCEDMRDDYWRLLSFQFVHSGVIHLLSNILVLLLYGSFFERYHPYGHITVFFLYQIAVVLGALGHSIIFPWTALVGCSPGVYGLVGAVLALLLTYRKRFTRVQYMISLLVITAQLVIDTVYYFLYYTEDIGYGSHGTGFFAGLTLGLTTSIFYSNKNTCIRLLATIGCAAFIIGTVYLLHHFFAFWAPVPYTHGLLHNTEADDGCCASLWSKYETLKNQYSFDEVKSMSQCSGNTYIFNGIFSRAISACAKGGQWKETLQLIGYMEKKGVAPDVYTYSAVISACEKSRQWKEALRVLDDMEKKGIIPNVITYSAAISACEKGKQWQETLRLLGDMEKKGIIPDMITYNAAISACEVCEEWEEALRLLDVMEKKGVAPDEIIYSKVISACEKRLQWKEALRLLSIMEKKGLVAGIILYSAAILYCEKCGEWEEALRLLGDMEKKGFACDFITYNAAILACEKGGQWKEASKLIRKMKEKGIASENTHYQSREEWTNT